MSAALTLQLLQIVRSIRDTGSVTRAARAAGVSQPAVSKLIAKAEAELGLAIIRRDTRPVRLTEEGQLIARQGEDIGRQVQALGDRLRAMGTGKAGAVRIGSFGPTASTRLLPRILARFHRRYPGIDARVFEAPDAQTQTDLANGVLDVAVLANPPEDLDSVPLARDHLVALVAPDGPLAGRSALSPADLAPHPFIMTLAGSEGVVRAWFRRGGVTPDVRHSIQQTHSIVALVAQGMGQSIVTSQSLPLELRGVQVVPLSPAWENQIHLVRQPGVAASRAVELFWDFAEGLDL